MSTHECQNSVYTVLAYIRFVLVGVACGLFEGAYYSAQIVQRCTVQSRARSNQGAQSNRGNTVYICGPDVEQWFSVAIAMLIICDSVYTVSVV